jgi:hypothetical protein
VAEQDDDVQACVCGCGTGGALWNGLRELERGARGAGTRRHTYAEVSARLSAMTQELKRADARAQEELR